MMHQLLRAHSIIFFCSGMMLWGCLLVMFVSFPLVLAQQGLDELQGLQFHFNDLVNGEHFDDVIDKHDGSFTAKEDTVLVIHNSQCPPTPTPPSMPSRAFLFYLTHNVDSLNYVWYDLTPKQDLRERYAPKSPDCLTAMFFKKHETLLKPGHRWNPTKYGTIEEWTWKMIKISVKITNNYGEELKVTFEGGDFWPALKPVFIKKNKEKKITCYPAYYMYIENKRTRKEIYKTMLGAENSDLTVEKFMTVTDLKKMYNHFDALDEKNWYWMQHHSDRAILLLKQPLFVTNYTSLGYKKMKMPTEMFDYILGIYYDRYDQRTPEKIADMEESQVINQRETRTSMVQLSEEEENNTAAALMPLLEEWCDCKLLFNVAWGIREYYAGNVLFRHVDRIKTHVIGVILQVHQELDGKDWPLEVIDYSGKRATVILKPGEMLLYESAKLIHSRPEVFEGKKFANAFFHFAPVDGWNYELKDGYIIDTTTGRYESVKDMKPTIRKDEL